MWTELTLLDGEKALVNLDNASYVRKNQNDTTSVLRMNNGEEVFVLEERNSIRQVLLRKKVYINV